VKRLFKKLQKSIAALLVLIMAFSSFGITAVFAEESNYHPPPLEEDYPPEEDYQYQPGEEYPEEGEELLSDEYSLPEEGNLRDRDREPFVPEQLQEVRVAAAEALGAFYGASNYTTYEEVLMFVFDVIANFSSISAAWSQPFTLSPATYTDSGIITGTIRLTYTPDGFGIIHNTDIAVSIMIPQLVPGAAYHDVIINNIPPVIYDPYDEEEEAEADEIIGQTGEGSYAAGEIVTLTAGSRAGFIFDVWEFYPSVEFYEEYDEEDEKISFIMPDEDVTATVLWAEEEELPPLYFGWEFSTDYAYINANINNLPELSINIRLSDPDDEVVSAAYQWFARIVGAAHATGVPVTQPRPIDLYELQTEGGFYATLQLVDEWGYIPRFPAAGGANGGAAEYTSEVWQYFLEIVYGHLEDNQYPSPSLSRTVRSVEEDHDTLIALDVQFDGAGFVRNRPPRPNFPNIRDINTGNIANHFELERYLNDPFTFFDSSLGTGGRVVTHADWWERNAEIRDLVGYYWFGLFPELPLENIEVTVPELNVNPNSTATTVLNVIIRSNGRVAVGNMGTITMPSQAQIDASPFNLIDGIPVVIGNGNAIFHNNGIATITPGGLARTTVWPNNVNITEFNQGTIMNTVWQSSRVLDVLEILFERNGMGVDPYKAATIGVSIGGKQAMFRGVMDERVALTVPVESGAFGMTHMRNLVEGYIPIYEGHTFASPWMRGQKPMNSWGFTGEAGWFAFEAPPGFIHPFGARVHPDYSTYRIPFDMHLVAALAAPRGLLSFDNDGTGSGNGWMNPFGQQLVIDAAREVYAFLGVPDNIGGRVRDQNHAVQTRDLPFVAATLSAMFGGGNNNAGRNMCPVGPITVVNPETAMTPPAYGFGTYAGIYAMGVTPFEVQSRFIQWARPGVHSIWTYTEVVTDGLLFTIRAYTTAPNGTQIQLRHLSSGPNTFANTAPAVIETWTATVTGGVAVFEITGGIGRYQLSFADSTALRAPVYFSGIDKTTALRSGASPGISHMYRSFGFTSRINMDAISVYIANAAGTEFYLPSVPIEEAARVNSGWGGNVGGAGGWGGWIMEYGIGIPNQNAPGSANNRLFNNGAVILRNVQLEAMPGFSFELSFASGATNGNPAHTGVLWPASEAVQLAQAFPFWPPPGGLSGSGGEGGAFGIRPDGTRPLRTSAEQPAFVNNIEFSHTGEYFGRFIPGDSIRIEFGAAMFPRDFGIGFDFSDDFDIEWGAGNEHVEITFNSFNRNVLNGSDLNMYIIRLRAAGGATGGASISAPIHNSFYVTDSHAFTYTVNGFPRTAGTASGGATTTEITINFTDSVLDALTLTDVALHDPMGVTQITGIRAGSSPSEWILELNGQVHRLIGNVYLSLAGNIDFSPLSLDEEWHPIQIYRELLEGEFIPDPPRAYFPRNPMLLPISPSLQDPFEFFAPIDGTSTLGTNGRVVTAADWEERRAEIRDLMMYYYYGFMWNTPIDDVSVNTSARPTANATINVTVVDDGTSGLGRQVTGNVATGVWLPTFEQLEANGFWDTAANTGTGGPLLISMGAVPVAQRDTLLARGIGVAVPAGVPGNENRTGLYFQLFPQNAEVFEFNSGSLMGNSWVVSRIIDAFELNPEWGVNPYAIATLGNSFQGKRALFAGVMDERVALTIPHESGGDGGVAPFRFSHAGRINFFNFDNFGAAANLFGRVHSRHETVFNGNAGRGGQGPADFFRQNVPYGQALHRIPFDMHLVLALVAGENRALLSLETDNFGSWTAWSPARTVAEAASEVWQFLGHDNLIYRQKGSSHAIHASDYPVIMAVLDYLFGQPVHNGAYRGGRNANQVYVEDLFNSALPGIWNGLSSLSRSPVFVESSWMPWSRPGTNAVWTTNEYITEGFPATIAADTNASGYLQLILWSHGDGNLLWGADPANAPVELNRWTAPIIDGTATFNLSADEVGIGRYELTTGNPNDRSAFFHGIDIATALRSGPTQDNIGGLGGSMMLGFTSRVNRDLEVWVGQDGNVTQRTLSPYQSFNSDNWLMNYGVRLAAIPGAGANRWYSLRNVQFEAMPGVTFEINFQQTLNTGGWPAPDMAVSWQASEAVQNIGPYPHWRPGGTGARPSNLPLPYMQNRTTQFEAVLTHSLEINPESNLVEAWIIDFSEPMNPREIGIGFDFGGAFNLVWSNNYETLTINFESPVNTNSDDVLNMYIMRLRDARTAAGGNAVQHNARTINQPIHYYFDLSEVEVEPDYIWSLSSYEAIQNLPLGPIDQNTLLSSPRLQGAGGLTWEVADNSGVNSIQMSGRSSNWHGLDVMLAPFNLTDGEYEITWIGRVIGTPAGNMVIGQPESPWNVMSQTPASAAFELSYIFTLESWGWPAQNRIRLQTDGAGANLVIIIDDIIIRIADDREPVEPPPVGEGVHPAEITLAPGRTRGFIITDDLPGGGPVIWSISGQQSPNTTINQGGFLQISEDEPITSNIIVRAERADDNTIYGTAGVAVRNWSVIDSLVRGLNFDQYPSLREIHADYFLIGAAGDGNVATGSFAGARGSLVEYHFNTWTFENSMKVQPLRGNNAANRLQHHSQWSSAPDNTIAGARHRYADMAMIGHTMAWHSQSPAWMWDRHIDGGPANRDTALENMQHHIRGTMTRWGAELQAMDVVNEAIGSVSPANPQDWRGALSRGEGWYPTLGYGWVEYAFIFAAEIADELGLDAKLYYNDFLLHTTNKGIAVYEMVKDINTRHAAGEMMHPITGEPFMRTNGRLLIEGIGMQDRQSGVLDIDGFEAAIRNFASLGVYVSITEMDLSWRITQPDGMLTHAEEIAQAQEYARLFELLRRFAAGPATSGSGEPRVIERVTFWGIDDAASWAPGQPMIFNAPVGSQITGKEALLAVLDPLRYLEMHPWSPPPPVVVHGIHVFNLENDGFTGMNIILGNDANEWPWSTAGENGQVAFTPQPGARYRMDIRYQTVGTFGLEAHWLTDNSFDNFTAANNIAAAAMQTIIRGDVQGSPAASIPARFSNPGVGGSFGRMSVEFEMPADAGADGLIGNIALRGIELGHEIVFYSAVIYRIGENGEDDILLVNWPNLVPLPPVPGIIVPEHGGDGGRADIIIGSGRGVWPHADAHESGLAFEPEAGVTYRIMFNVTTTGATGWRVRWMPGTGGEDYTTTDGAVVNSYPMRMSTFGLGVPTQDMISTIPTASFIPSHPNAGASAAGVYTIVQDITLDGDEVYQGLIGNIAFRGTGGSGNFFVNWITIERLEGGPASAPEELLAFWPYGVDQFDNFVNNFEAFAGDFTPNPLNVGTGANAVTATITRDAEVTAINTANPPHVGDTLVASITAGTAAGAGLGTRAGTTGGVLAGNVTYTWSVGSAVVQEGSKNTFTVLPEHFGYAIQLQITSDWETGALISTTPVVSGGFVLEPNTYDGIVGIYVGGSSYGFEAEVIYKGFEGMPLITINTAELPNGVNAQVDGLTITFNGIPEVYGVFTVTVTASYGALTTYYDFIFNIVTDNVITEPVQLTAPSNLAVFNAVLTWNAVENAAGYRIYAGGIASSTVITATSFNLANLNLEAGTHSIQIRAIGDGSSFTDSQLSLPISFVVAPTFSALPAPAGLSITGTSLSWNAVENAVGYRVYVAGTSRTDLLTAATFNLATLGLGAGTHIVSVRAIGTGSFTDSALSSTINFIIQASQPPTNGNNQNNDNDGEATGGTGTGGGGAAGGTQPTTTPQQAQPAPPQQAPQLPQQAQQIRWSPSLTPPLMPPMFTDVNPNAWYANYVLSVAAAGAFQGTGAGIFSPGQSMTRAMFAQVLANLDGANLSAFADATPTFTDVLPDAWYFAAVEWAASLGIVTGMGDGSFNPNASVTRETMSVMLFRFIEVMGIDIPLGAREGMQISASEASITFTDRDAISYWAEEPVSVIQAMGIVSGRPDGRFDPRAAATRGEVAAVFVRFLELVL